MKTRKLNRPFLKLRVEESLSMSLKEGDIEVIDPFSVSKHCDIFLWAELSWRQKESSDHFTNASCEVC